MQQAREFYYARHTHISVAKIKLISFILIDFL